MTRIYVEHEKLVEMGEFLTDKSIEIGELLEKMQSTVESISNGWDGQDAFLFKVNASNYIENLQRVEVGLSNCSGGMLKNESRYAKAVYDYLSSFKKEKDDL